MPIMRIVICESNQLSSIINVDTLAETFSYDVVVQDADRPLSHSLTV